MHRQQHNNNNNTRVTVAGDPAGVTRGLVFKGFAQVVSGVCYASVPPRASLWRRYRPTVDQEVGIRACSLQNKPKITHKNERASIPLGVYPDVVSAISANKTAEKSAPSIAVRMA